MKKTLLTLSLTVLATGYLAHQANNLELPTNERYEYYSDILEDEGCTTDSECEALHGMKLDGTPTDIVLRTEITPLPDPIPTEDAPPPAPEEATPTLAPDEVIYEDDPRWDCTTMGNMICGTDINGTWYLLDFKTGTFTARG